MLSVFAIIKTVIKYVLLFSDAAKYPDKLTMYDGGSMTSPMIGEYCYSTPPDIITTRNQIFVHFETSYIDTGIGFKLMYNSTSK